MSKIHQSSNLQRTGDYDPRTRTFTQTFVALPGVTYVVGPVDRSTYDGLLRAGSPGQYYDAKIKKAGIAVRRVSQ